MWVIDISVYGFRGFRFKFLLLNYKDEALKEVQESEL